MVRTLSDISESRDSQICKNNIFKDIPIYFLIFFEVFGYNKSHKYGNIVFLPEIIATSERPDMVIWSVTLKKVIMIELTCPAEEGIEAARVRKLARYEQLKQDIANAGWVADLLTIEVGARGYVAYSTERCFRQLVIPKRTVSSLCKSPRAIEVGWRKSRTASNCWRNSRNDECDDVRYEGNERANAAGCFLKICKGD